MKICSALLLALMLGISFAANAHAQDLQQNEGKAMEKSVQKTKIRITFDGGEAVVTLFDNSVSKDFASLLPLKVTLEDYAGAEKITYLPKKLTTQGGVSGQDVQGDFTYYAPWGNLAVFYKGFGKASGLYILGRIDSGKEKLAAMKADFSARLEVIK